jgi:hypothetical protein
VAAKAKVVKRCLESSFMIGNAVNDKVLISVMRKMAWAGRRCNA